MTQNANTLRSSSQHMWQHCFDNVSASACSSPGIGCCASTSWKPHSVFPVKLVGVEIGSGSEQGSLLRWAGCEQLLQPAQLRCFNACPFLPTRHWSVLRQCPQLSGQRPQAARRGVHTSVGRSQFQWAYAWCDSGYSRTGAKAPLATWELHPAVAACIAGVPGTALAAHETDCANIADKTCFKP